MPRILELGCGLEPCAAQPGEEIVHLDRCPLPHVEQVWNLDEFPYPFPDNAFDRVIAFDVLEHLSDVRRTMEELWRIARPGARILIRVPHWASFLAHRDPTHRASFDAHSFDYFGPGRYSYYSHARFIVRATREIERYPRLFRLLRTVAPRLERGLKRHLLDMITTITFDLEVVKSPTAAPDA